MSLGECPRCWDDPCTCGHEYRNWPRAKKIKLVKAILSSEDMETLLIEIKAESEKEHVIEEEYKRNNEDW